MNTVSSEAVESLDQKLSQRLIALDPCGYFLIKVDRIEKELLVEHFSNDINDSGTAIDPDTGEPLSCTGGPKRSPISVFRGRSAKEVGIQLTEGESPHPISRLDHALYLGRELQKAEACLFNGNEYIQD